MTLDVIGLAGFNYNFQAMETREKPNELNAAFKTIFQGDTSLPVLQMLRMFIPALRVIVSPSTNFYVRPLADLGVLF